MVIPRHAKPRCRYRGTPFALKEECAPIKQKLRRVKPEMLLKIKEAVKKQLDAGRAIKLAGSFNRKNFRVWALIFLTRLNQGFFGPARPG